MSFFEDAFKFFVIDDKQSPLLTAGLVRSALFS